MKSKLNLICECLKEEIEKKRVSETFKHKLFVQLKSAKKHLDIIKNKLKSCPNKLYHPSPHNLNKRLKTQKGNFQVLKEKLCIKKEKLENLKLRPRSWTENLDEVLKAVLKERKNRYCWKNLSKRNASKNDNSSFSQSYADQLNNQIMYLQNEQLQLAERMQDFVANRVNFFHYGKYDDNNPTVY